MQTTLKRLQGRKETDIVCGAHWAPAPPGPKGEPHALPDGFYKEVAQYVWMVLLNGGIHEGDS